ncbi:flavin reductase (DIM6/NTAB) family NADH-FMN oxidoreductase RutF [Streptomyces sp. BK208]|uniref:flavin reductase family protein n=1 Tax=Streptomyces sp. BK208 TaxID=2512150 RepID=UPI00105E2811|nr:flavin reductase family protein [Streptomyces sp. BK208]TDT42697.1 flavin reductase (DIM6/NTAB) family NADH-FMN oxidoreductase RutF [Streptomyces sp. BK208]
MTTEPAGLTAPTGQPADLRTLMAAFPTGVSVVTAVSRDGANWGMTCTSLCSVSLHPPVLLVCLRCGSPTLEAVAGSGLFAVNLLHEQARPTAELFASGVPDRFERVVWEAKDGAAGPHLTFSSHTIADCSVVSTQVVGDHTMVLGKVDVVTPVRVQRPLLYGLRGYSAWPGPRPGAVEKSARASGEAGRGPDTEEAP